VDTRYGCYLSCVSQKDWFSSFDKLDDCSVEMGDARPCNMEGIGTVLIKMFDRMVPKLKKVRYVPQLKKILISVGVLDALGLGISDRDGILKMIRGSTVVLRGVQCNNFYYLKSNTVTWEVATSIGSDDDYIQLRHMRFGYTSEKSFQALAKNVCYKVQDLQVEFVSIASSVRRSR